MTCEKTENTHAASSPATAFDTRKKRTRFATRSRARPRKVFEEMGSTPSRSSVKSELNVTRECEVVESEDGEECVILHRGPAKKRVLVVDDCEERLLAVKRALESENDGGFYDLVVEPARSGDECLEITRDVVRGSRTMRTSPDVVLISQGLGAVGGRSMAAEDDDSEEDHGRRVEKDVGAKKGGMSGVDCCAGIRRHGALSCMGEQFLHVVLLTEDRPEYVFDREEFDKQESPRDRRQVGDNWNSASDYEKETWTRAYVSAGVTKTLPNNLSDADLLAAVKRMLNRLPVVDRSYMRYIDAGD